MGRYPRGGIVQSPGRARGLHVRPGAGAQAKNGVGRLPREEAADAVVKEKSLRPW